MMGRNDANPNAKRAENEEFTFTVNGDGTVTVRNDSHANPHGHVYDVSVRGGGFVADCTCPHRRHRGERCKHMIAVEKQVVPSLPDGYGDDGAEAAADGDDGKAGDADAGDAEAVAPADGADAASVAADEGAAVVLSPADVRDVRQALATEIADAHEAGRPADADRLAALRSRFAADD